MRKRVFVSAALILTLVGIGLFGLWIAATPAEVQEREPCDPDLRS